MATTKGLKKRCAEILQWQETGMLPDPSELRKFARKECPVQGLAHSEQLSWAERETARQAMRQICEEK